MKCENNNETHIQHDCHVTASKVAISHSPKGKKNNWGIEKEARKLDAFDSWKK